MKNIAATALALSLAAPGVRAQQPKSRNSAAAKIGGQPSNPPEIGSSADTQMRKRAAGRQPPSLAQPTREEILETQRRGRIRDRDVPDWIRGQQLTELEVPNSLQLQEVLKNAYRHRQDDLTP